MAYSKFIRLTHVDAKDGSFTRSPLFVDPKDVEQITNHCVYLKGNTYFTVEDKAEDIHQMVINKLEENKQHEVMW